MKITCVQVCYAGWIQVLNDLVLVIKHYINIYIK